MAFHELKFRIIYLKINGERGVVTVEATSAPAAIEKAREQVDRDMNVWYALVDVKRIEK